MTIRVYLVDDHALVRTGMKMILSGETDIEVVGEAETGEDALRDVRQLLPDVVLCDLHLPGAGTADELDVIDDSDLLRVIEDYALHRPMLQGREPAAGVRLSRSDVRTAWVRRPIARR